MKETSYFDQVKSVILERKKTTKIRVEKTRKRSRGKLR